MQLRLHAGNAVIQERHGNLWLIHRDQVNVNLYRLNKPNETVIDEVVHVEDDVEVSLTLPFQVCTQISIDVILGRHVFQASVGDDIVAAFKNAGLILSPEMVVLKQDGNIVQHDHLIASDLRLSILFVEPHVRRLLVDGATWVVIQPGTVIRHLLHTMPSTKIDDFRFYDLSGTCLSHNWVAADRQLIVIMHPFTAAEKPWECIFHPNMMVSTIQRQVSRCMPDMFVCASHICIRTWIPVAMKQGKLGDKSTTLRLVARSISNSPEQRRYWEYACIFQNRHSMVV